MKLKEYLRQKAAEERRTPAVGADAKTIECPPSPPGLFACVRYKLVVSAAICGRCKREPEFKQSLFADYVRNRAARGLPCAHRGERVETVEVPCCGSKTIKLGRYPCDSAARIISDPDCWLCNDYQVTK